MIVTGRAAHAGIEPEKGVNAVHELFFQIGRLMKWNDPRRGITVQATVISGGTASNVVPAHASAQIDIRYAHAADARLIERKLRSLRPILKGARIDVRTALGRPPLERTAAVEKLFRQAQSLMGEMTSEMTHEMKRENAEMAHETTPEKMRKITHKMTHEMAHQRRREIPRGGNDARNGQAARRSLHRRRLRRQPHRRTRRPHPRRPRRRRRRRALPPRTHPHPRIAPPRRPPRRPPRHTLTPRTICDKLRVAKLLVDQNKGQVDCTKHLA